MGLKHWFNSQSDAMKIAIVTVIGGGIVTGAFTLANTELTRAPISNTPATTASASATRPISLPTPSAPITSMKSPSSTSSGCQGMLTITGPPEDASITSGSDKTFYITGTACGLRGDTGWLFDYDSDDHYYYDDYNGTVPTAAVRATQSGNWKFPDVGIGDSGDQNKLYTITLVLASPLCAQRLRTAPPVDGDYKWKTFPAGCTVSGMRDVYVTYP